MRPFKWRFAVSGALAGLANGLFGAGGGLLLVPLLTRWGGLEDREAFATSVAVIFPMCAVSALIYLTRTDLSLLTALPFLLGGTIGGFFGGKWFRKLSMPWLRRIFACFILYGGVRSLL